ncbi:MAG: putative porin, partial [Bacteroidota bacterium]|nr:putative porin [Bacteroidota bacterium]
QHFVGAFLLYLPDMKIIITLFISILAFIQSGYCSNNAKDTIPPAKIVAHQFNSDFTSLDSIVIDTTLIRYQLLIPPFSERSLNPYLGNLNAPYISALYSNRKTHSDFLFSENIEYNFHQPEENVYYRARSPYTILNYFTGGPKSRQEQKLNFIHTQNVNKNLNLGLIGNLGYSDGQLINQKIRANSFTFFAGYKGARYSIYGSASVNSYKGQENGGITSDSIYRSGEQLSTIPVNLENANTAIQRQSIFFMQRYYLTGSFKEDSLKKNSSWNEVLSIIHRVKFDNYKREFTDALSTAHTTGSSKDSSFYQNFYYSTTNTDDIANYRSLDNTLQLAFNANQLLKVPAELRVGIKNQIDYFSFAGKKKDYLNNAFVGTLSDRFSKTISWGASAEYYFTGYKAGNIELTGDLQKTIKRNFILRLSGRLATTRPSYFLNDYKSNHFEWSKGFDNMQSSTVKIGLYHRKLKLSIEGQSDNLNRFVYFDQSALPNAAKGFSVYSLSVNKQIDWGVLHSDFRLTFQRTGDEDAVSIPYFSGFNSTYLTFAYFKVLKFQLGAEVFYNTSYYSNAYMPATGMFYTQKKVKTGDYPYADMFLNINLKRTRFFLKYERINSWFPNNYGYFVPQYPFNPSMLKYGISWTFYD